MRGKQFLTYVKGNAVGNCWWVRCNVRETNQDKCFVSVLENKNYLVRCGSIKYIAFVCVYVCVCMNQKLCFVDVKGAVNYGWNVCLKVIKL